MTYIMVSFLLRIPTQWYYLGISYLHSKGFFM